MAELNGIVIVNKEKGFTSHDAVNVIRRILGTRKVGHTGTLDPNAVGVLQAACDITAPWEDRRQCIRTGIRL